MSLRITIPKPIVELLKHKFDMDEAQIKQEIVKLVYDLVTGETKSVLWETNFANNVPKSSKRMPKSDTVGKVA